MLAMESLESSSWDQSSLVVLDLSEQCRAAHNIAAVSAPSNRPCLRFDNLMSPSECTQILRAVSEQHEQAPTSLEPGVRSQICLVDVALQELLWKRIRRVIPQELDGGTAVGLQAEWRHGMYHAGQSVFAHMDFEHIDRSDDLICSRLSLTVYLNDNFSGGDTAFVREPIGYDGSHGGIFYRSVPKAGSAILFYQNVPEYYHTAESVDSGCKFIMRSDVMYKFKDKEAVRIKTRRL